MTAPFDHLDDGYPEQSWAADHRWSQLPRLRIEAGRGLRKLVLLAAHPDDETLGAGGLLQTCAAAGIPAEVIIASDGEASHPHSPTHSRADLAQLRQVEVRAAVAALAPDATVLHLGLPDGELASCVQALSTVVRDAVADLGVGVILAAPWRLDGHPDHDALGALAAAVAAQTGALLLEYPIWWWHAGAPDDTPWSQLTVLDLSEAAHAAKQAALVTHTTQVRPLSDAPGDEVLLNSGMLAHFDRPFETFLDTAGRARMDVFERLYAGHVDPWGVRDSDYERRKRALTLAMLPLPRFVRAFEPGCSIGELSAALAPRCDALVVQDLSETAVQAARVRLAQWPQVQALHGSMPQDWPGGNFDLIVLSEVGYFLSSSALDDVLHRARTSLIAGGYVLLCHWAHPIDGWELDGPAVHARAADVLDLPLHGRHIDLDVLLEIFGPCP